MVEAAEEMIYGFHASFEELNLQLHAEFKLLLFIALMINYFLHKIVSHVILYLENNFI